MKRILTSKILRKVMILSFLLVGLVFVVSGDNVQSADASAKCCYDCPGGGDPFAAEAGCATGCGGDTNPCFYSCMSAVDGCYATCHINCSGGGPQSCQFDTQCQPGSFCINNYCS